MVTARIILCSATPRSITWQGVEQNKRPPLAKSHIVQDPYLLPVESPHSCT